MSAASTCSPGKARGGAPAGGSGGAPSLTGAGAEGEQVFVLPPLDKVFGACTPAVVPRHRFAKDVNVFFPFVQLYLTQPSSEQN